MLKEETWSISIQRARAFFREQEDVTEESANVYCYGSCRIQLTELKPRVWASGLPSVSASIWRARRQMWKTFITAILSNFSQQEADICPNPFHLLTYG